MPLAVVILLMVEKS
nr:unnamed protein product [Callosobruchus chinensis]